MEQELPLVGEPPFAEPQHRRAYAAGRTGQRHHVHFHLRVHHHLLPGAHLGDGCDLVPQQRRRLKFQPVRGLLHPLVEDLQDVLFAVADHSQRTLHGIVVGLASNLSAANGHALAYIRIEIVDENGVVVPDAAIKLHADVKGAGKLAAFGSANPITDENYTAGDFTSYRGVATAIVQSGYEAGLCTLTVSGEGFEEKSVELKIK